jgi:N-ethylmaleimide reductase
MINDGFTKDSGNAIIAEDYADLVAYGKPFISNPDLVECFVNDTALVEWDENTFYTKGIKGYTDYSKAIKNK